MVMGQRVLPLSRYNSTESDHTRAMHVAPGRSGRQQSAYDEGYLCCPRGCGRAAPDRGCGGVRSHRCFTTAIPKTDMWRNG